MNWLRQNVYLAAWLSPVVAIVVAIVQNRHRKSNEVDWSRLLIYIAFLTALAVAFTPTFDDGIRSVASGLVYAGLGFLIVDRKAR